MPSPSTSSSGSLTPAEVAQTSHAVVPGLPPGRLPERQLEGIA